MANEQAGQVEACQAIQDARMLIKAVEQRLPQLSPF